MEDINYKKLIDIVEKSTKATYITYKKGNRAVNNVANLGAKIGDVVKLERSGEYYGIAVEIMEDLKPLLTSDFVIRILSMLKKEDYITPASILNLSSLDQLLYILHYWFSIATTEYNGEIKDYKKSYSIFDKWIETVTHDPLLGKIKVVDVGYNQNTGNSVVPIEWIDREFANGNDLHEAMNKLETRIGKPPVTYAIIYSMIIQKEDNLIDDISKIKFDTIFYLDWLNNEFRFVSEMTTKTRKDYQYVQYDNVLIGFKIKDILEPKEKAKNQGKEVGLLVSRLQKSIRRGRYGSQALIETIDALNISPNYNLPEHNFLRVSSSKQMVWRLFITILEDCRPYQSANEISLLELILLTLITQKNQEYKFTQPVLTAIKFTALLAQYNDQPTDLYEQTKIWASLPSTTKISLFTFSTKSDFHNALSLALNNIIMMNSDNRMLKKYYSINVKNIFEPFTLPEKLKNDNWHTILPNIKYLFHKSDVYDDIVLSSYDMHVKNHIILYYQACIPVSLTTKEISSYIWDVSSSYNVRANKTKTKIDPILRSIQKYFLEEMGASV